MGLGQTQTQSAKLVCQGPCWPEKVTETKLGLLVPRADGGKPSRPPDIPHSTKARVRQAYACRCRASVLNKTVGLPTKALAHLGGGDGEPWVRSAERRMMREGGAQLSPCRGPL